MLEERLKGHEISMNSLLEVMDISSFLDSNIFLYAPEYLYYIFWQWLIVIIIYWIFVCVFITQTQTAGWLLCTLAVLRR